MNYVHACFRLATVASDEVDRLSLRDMAAEEVNLMEQCWKNQTVLTIADRR
jgi:hypothetical protein